MHAANLYTSNRRKAQSQLKTSSHTLELLRNHLSSGMMCKDFTIKLLSRKMCKAVVCDVPLAEQNSYDRWQVSAELFTVS
jgi:hypothetical protein